jgi:LPPG:FO 2-phospho-L-lactate transferase
LQANPTSQRMKVVALAGGVGGAKLAHGLAQSLPAEDLTIVVNTGDDFNHLGLRICPDLDTVCYTLAGLANPVTGWGRVDESSRMMENLARLNGPTWFNLGDQDLATHLERTRRLALGDLLSTVTRDFCAAWGVRQRVLPMTDDPVATWVETEESGWLPFQEYFVHQLCKPRVKSFRFAGAEKASPAPGVMEAIEAADFVVICPSNPWVSIGPILSVAPLGDRLNKVGDRLSKMKERIAAVSPIVGGQAIKGPAAKMYQELGIAPSALAVARQYTSLLNGFVMDNLDQDQAQAVSALGMEVLVTDTVMKTIDDRRRLAEEVLQFCGKLNGR